MLDINAYLRRIDYHGSLEPAAETLRGLHRAHMLTVPFENLDIHARRPLTLDEAGLFAKIVQRRRGGFCYEMNGLYAALLRALGFRVTMLGAQVVLGAEVDPPELGPGPFTDHLTLLVHLEERWLADVGFGDSFVEPLRLDEPDEQVQDRMAYRIRQDDTWWTLLQRDAGGGWAQQYVFTLQPRRLADFADACRAAQARPFWNERPRCSRATPEGRVTVADMKLVMTTRGVRREQPLRDQDEYAAALREHFGVDHPTA
jgi:N-hydroxyarylamine O-acetyltransferase